MPRPPRPEDLYRLRVATEPRLSPDGRFVAVTLQTVAPAYDGYRSAIWLVPSRRWRAAPGDARRATRPLPRFSPDGRTLAFLSDRRSILEEEPGAPDGKDREDAVQVHLLPLDGGEARRLTDLPRGVTGFEWSPDGTRLVVVTPSIGSTRAEDDRRRGIERRPDPRDAAVLRLPVHRSPRLHAQRDRVHATTGSRTCGWSTSRPGRPAG